jgi:hypothetical protein
MARVKGKKVSGSIGNITHRDTRDGQVASEKVTTIRQSKNTKNAGLLFGKASGLTSFIRSNMEPIMDGLNDGGLHQRLTAETLAVLGRYFDDATKCFNFVKHSFRRLAGRDFNINSPFRNSLWVVPEVNTEGNDLTIKIPEIINGRDLIFKRNTNLCLMQFQLSMYALSSGYYRNDITFEFEIPIKQEVIAAQEWRFVIPNGCLAVVGIALHFCRLIGNRMIMANSKTFSPGQVCGAVFIPGEFILPPQESIHRVKLLWKTMHLNFPAGI